MNVTNFMHVILDVLLVFNNAKIHVNIIIVIKNCGEKCVPCIEPCDWICEHHQCTKKCHEPCNRPRCEHSCDKILLCGHRCIGVCGEPCPPVCSDPECNDNEDDEDEGENSYKIQKIVYDADMMPKDASGVDEKEQYIWLEECQHIFEKSCLDRYVDMFSQDRNGAIKLLQCPMCRTPIRKCYRYGTIINEIWNDLETIKAKISAQDCEKDRKEVYEAMKAELGGNGHWFKCPNGHYYCIGGCGGAMETARCPECKEQIGGDNHTLLSTNQFAPEVENPDNPNQIKPAWPTVLNR